MKIWMIALIRSLQELLWMGVIHPKYNRIHYVHYLVSLCWTIHVTNRFAVDIFLLLYSKWSIFISVVLPPFNSVRINLCCTPWIIQIQRITGANAKNVAEEDEELTVDEDDDDDDDKDKVIDHRILQRECTEKCIYIK